MRSKGLDNYELKSGSRCMLSRSRITDEDHPLSLGKASAWNTYFQVTISLAHINSKDRIHSIYQLVPALNSFINNTGY